MHLFVEQLTNVDFSYLDAKRGVVGETWWASAILEGALDDQGMVCDFGIVKKTLRQWLDLELDHRLLVPTKVPGLKIETTNDHVKISMLTGRGIVEMSAPAQAVTLIDTSEITADSVAAWSIQQLQAFFPQTIDQLTLDFTPETINGAFYHYSHGLKKHAGNCQRIAHGHRSRIQIWLNGERSDTEETYWAERWQDIYIGSKEDLSSENADTLSFAYTAEQGDFSLTLAREHCYMMSTDSTVELIADHLAQEIKLRHPEQNVRVRAFEGVNKGAMVKR